MQTEVIAQGKFLQLVKTGRWEFVERKGVNGVVVIVPFLDDGRVLFIEQFRPPVNATCIAFPAGLSGDLADAADESLSAAARRELLEETGFTAHDFEYLGSSVASAGLTSKNAAYFVARGLHRVAAGGGVDNEKITTHLVCREEVRGWLAEQARRAVVSATVYAGLYLTGQYYERSG